MIQMTRLANNLKLTWPNTAGAYGLQSAPSAHGPWNDFSAGIILSGTNLYTIVPSSAGPFFRLVTQ
jgi:hypothetical protein